MTEDNSRGKVDLHFVGEIVRGYVSKNAIGTGGIPSALETADRSRIDRAKLFRAAFGDGDATRTGTARRAAAGDRGLANGRRPGIDRRDPPRPCRSRRGEGK
jgi:hypothetical protein